ncbi:MAG: hypothetical protein ACRBDI_05380 [Alphaproteobacteria bacterium]
MASFDFIEASTKGYEFVWDKATYLMRVAIPVIFVKVFCLLTAFSLQLEVGSLIYGLAVLPSYAIEGIFVIGLIRYFIYREPIYVWGSMVPCPETKQTDLPFFIHPSSERKRPMQAGIALYILIWVILLCLVGLLPKETAEATAEPRPEIMAHQAFFAFTVMAGMLYGMIWSMRIFFSYIPLTLDYTLSEYLKKMEGFKSSAMIALTLVICTMPILIIDIGILNLLDIMFGQGSAAFIVGKAILESILGIFTISIQVVAITYGICHIMSE